MLIKKLLGRLRRHLKTSIYLIELYRKYRTHKNNILLFGSPSHSNMGDQAQTYCITKWFEHNYPEYNINIFTLPVCCDRLYRCLRSIIRPDDKIFFHSGYHLTDLYDEKRVYCEILKRFKNYEIFVFPQTIHFENPEIATRIAKAFNDHGRVKLLCRDNKSYENARDLFCGCECYLYPDVVTSLIGTKSYQHDRAGVLFCMRNDKEALYSKTEIEDFIKRLSCDYTVEMTDTTLNISHAEIRSNREGILDKIFEEYSTYKVVVTDRYHGTIFSLISGTPVVVLSSTDHKLSSGVAWFPDSFGKHVSFASNLDEAYELINIFSGTPSITSLPPYFKEKYFDNLRSDLAM